MQSWLTLPKTDSQNPEQKHKPGPKRKTGSRLPFWELVISPFFQTLLSRWLSELPLGGTRIRSMLHGCLIKLVGDLTSTWDLENGVFLGSGVHGTWDRFHSKNLLVGWFARFCFGRPKKARDSFKTWKCVETTDWTLGNERRIINPNRLLYLHSLSRQSASVGWSRNACRWICWFLANLEMKPLFL